MGVTAELFAASNVLIVAGKGGVGKTTVGASVAIAAARAGCDVLAVELEGHSSLGPLVGVDDLGYDEQEVAVEGSGRMRVRQLKPDDALADYLDRAGLGPVTNRLTRTGAMDVVVTAAPGIRDLLTLGKIRQIEQAGAADLIVVDAPAAGHALTFLTAPAGLADSATGGPIKDQAEQVLELFADDRRCQVMLVTLAEETPVSETIETAFSLEEDVGIKLAPVVVNGLWPEIDGLADVVGAFADTDAVGAFGEADGSSGDNQADELLVAAGRYRLARVADQQTESRRLADELPLPQIHLPYLFQATIGRTGLDVLAQSVSAQADLIGS